MITAKEAAETSQAYDQEANFKKIHDFWINALSSYIQSKASEGDTQVDWVPVVAPEEYPDELYNRAEQTIIEAGYNLTRKRKGVYNIRWA